MFYYHNFIMKKSLKSNSKTTARSKKTRATVCYLITEPDFFTNWHINRGAAHEQDINILAFTGGALHSRRRFEAERNKLYNLLNKEYIDGMIITSGLSNFVGAKRLKKFLDPFYGLPMVAEGMIIPGIPSCTVDYYHGMREAFLHLIKDHGYRRMAFIRGPKGSQGAEELYRAYLDALKAYQIPFNPDLVIMGDFWSSSGSKAVDIFLDQRGLTPHKDLEIIVAANDHMAFGVIKALQKRGIVVPDELAVTGFDDIEPSQWIIPHLTTVRKPNYEMKYQAIKMVSALCRGLEVPEKVMIPAKLIIRTSCGCQYPTVATITHKNQGQPLSNYLYYYKDRIHAEIMQTLCLNLSSLGIYHQERIVTEKIQELVRNFASGLKGNDPGGFLAKLKKTLNNMLEAGGNIFKWQKAIAVMRDHYLAGLAEQETRLHAEELLVQMQALINNITREKRQNLRLQTDKIVQVLDDMEEGMVTAFDVKALAEMFTRVLTRLKIKHGYLCLYENSRAGVGVSRLIFAYERGRHIRLKEEGVVFPSSKLLPQGMLPKKGRFNMIVEPLFFHKKQIGFLLLGDSLEYRVYEVLRRQLSIALNGILILEDEKKIEQSLVKAYEEAEKQAKERTTELAQEKKGRKRIEEALAHEQYLLRALMANIPDHIYFKDIYSRYMGMNNAQARHYGLKYPAQAVGKTDFDFLSERHARKTYEDEQQVMATGKPLIDIEEKEIWSDGRTSWVSSTKLPLFDKEGKIIGTFGISRDITERKQAEKEREQLLIKIKEQALRMQEIMDTVPEGVVLLNSLARIELANPAAREFLAVLSGAKVGDILANLADHSLSEILTPHSRGLWYEIRIEEPSLKIFEVTARPIQISDLPGGWVIVIRDATADRQIKDLIQQQERLAVVGQLAAGIAHYFNNLLTGISGFTELMKKHIAKKDPLLELTDSVLASNKNAAKLVNQLLIFSQKKVFTPQVVDINALISNLEKMLKQIIGEDIELQTDLQPGLEPVKVDPAHLEEVIVNLAVNARDAMSGGGRLIIKTTMEPPDESLLPGPGSRVDGCYVMLSVKDTGAGMSDLIKAHIFEPFFTTKEMNKGTGLGLATVYSIIKQSDGYISVDTKEGGGSTFKIYLPPCSEKSEPMLSAEDDRKMPAGSETILLVEDNADVRRLMQFVLQKQGYKVMEASNASDALRLVAGFSAPINLLLTDVVMPGMDGKTLAEQLLKIYPGLKILFISGYADTKPGTQGILDRNPVFLKKPFTPRVLARKIREVLDG
jgi:two-component system cell cycle sensor histidine kinase/response regulator CckA